MADKPATVYIVDDDREVRQSLELLLRSVDTACASFDSGEQFLDAFDADRPACLLLDVRMPGLSGLELQHKLTERGFASPVIVMTAYGEVELAVQAMKDGAADFVQKPFSPQAMLEKVQAALAADTERCRREACSSQVRQRLDSLTPRERQIMDLLLEGEIPKRIAFKLDLSIKTVDFHRRNMMEKMGAETGIELAQMVSGLADEPSPP